MADAASLSDLLTSSASSNGMSADIELTLHVTLHIIQTLMVAMTGFTHVKRVFDTDARTSFAECSAPAHSHLVQTRHKQRLDRHHCGTSICHLTQSHSLC